MDDEKIFGMWGNIKIYPLKLNISLTDYISTRSLPLFKGWFDGKQFITTFKQLTSIKTDCIYEYTYYKFDDLLKLMSKLHDIYYCNCPRFYMESLYYEKIKGNVLHNCATVKIVNNYYFENNKFKNYIYDPKIYSFRSIYSDI